jgi:acyl dehydratase
MAILNRDTKNGFELTGNLKTVTEERVFAFSGGFPKGTDWPKKNIHTNLEFAKKSGLSDRAASGATFEGYLIELMINAFGEDWLKTGKMSLKFIRIVSPGDSIIPKAVVQSKEIKRSVLTIVLDIWCENQNGDKVVIGTATGILK